MYFVIVIDEIDFWMSKGYTPYIGGDFNSRIGNIGSFSSKSLNWKYEENIDKGDNGNRSSFRDMCEVMNILPINHCIYNRKKFEGGFTYYKGGKKSQIDFIVTNNTGRRNIEKFSMIKEGWHFSDHIPLDIDTRLTYDISALSLLLRSKSLIKETEPSRNNVIKTFKKEFDFNTAKLVLETNAVNISTDCTYSPPDFIVNRLHEEMKNAITTSAVPSRRINVTNENTTLMNECDECFKLYLSELEKGNSDVLSELFADY